MSLEQPARLPDLVSLILAEEDLGAHLDGIAAQAGPAVGDAACSVMLLSEGDPAQPRLSLWATTESMPHAAWAERPGPGDSIVGRVLQDGRERLVEDIERSDYAALARRRAKLGASFMCLPVTIGERTIGVVSLSNRVGAPSFDKSHLLLARLGAMLVAKSVQVERLQTLLRSRVAEASLSKEEKHVVKSLTEGSVPPAQIAKMLAKSFYKDLAAAGFEPGQIVTAASEIIGQVSTHISGHKKRLARQKK